MRQTDTTATTQVWPHQQTAIDDTLSTLTGHERATVVMACGTGKTLVGQRTAEQLQSDTVLVLFPNLGVLNQTYLAWCRDSAAGFHALAVCSDASIGVDDRSHVGVHDLDLPATTDPARVAAWARPDGHRTGAKVVFATYQSTPVIAQAHMQHQLPDWGLIICDEAHRTSGDAHTAFATVLHNHKIPARQRLFLTATPRTTTVSTTQPGSQTTSAASMDDETLFGPRAHTLDFGDAVDQGLLSDYRIVLIGVRRADMHQVVDTNPQLQIGDDQAVTAETMAAQIALGKVVAHQQMRRVFVFHNSVGRSQEFAHTLPDVLDTLPDRPAVHAWHLDAASTARQRRAVLDDLAAAGDHAAVVSNVRVLGEGIDAPALDAVMFADPRTSQVDIAQAVGRVMRTNPHRDGPALVLLPVFIGDGDDPQTVADRSRFRHVAKTLAALSDMDPLLADHLVRPDTGQDDDDGGGGRRLPGAVLSYGFGEQIPAGFVDAFTTVVLHQPATIWARTIDELRRYRAEHGHLHVPRGHVSPSGYRLGDRVSNLRQARRGTGRGGISDARIAELDRLGFVWGPGSDEEKFRQDLADLYAFQEQHGHLRVPADYTGASGRRELASRATALRQRHKAGTLTTGQVEALERLGFSWNPRGSSSHRQDLADLAAFRGEHGHAEVPFDYRTSDGRRFGYRVDRIRRRRRAGKLPAARVADLDQLGFVWDPVRAIPPGGNAG